MHSDPQQKKAQDLLARACHSLNNTEEQKGSWWRFLTPAVSVGSFPKKGVYLWGGVGRGKTMLMDRFFLSLKTTHKIRIHFHHCMQEWHQVLHQSEGVASPMEQIVKNLVKKYQVICLDEIVVSDIGDAQIFGAFLQTVLRYPIFLVMTSNDAPCDLYREGLQRSLFLPAIAVIEEEMEVLSLGSGYDYRCQDTAGTIRYACGTPDVDIEENFLQYSIGEERLDTVFFVASRKVQAVMRSRQAVWFEFSFLCMTARSVMDYLELANSYAMLFISGIPQLGDEQSAAVKRFIHFIDVCYDQKVYVFVYGAVPLDDLYQGAQCRKEWERLKSRLR
jgi:cell division protein ZapE